MALEKYNMDFQKETSHVTPLAEKSRRRCGYRRRTGLNVSYFGYGNGTSNEYKPSRKRNSTTAQLSYSEDFLDVISNLKDLKLMPVSKERLEIADKLFKTPQLTALLLDNLPESALRQMAMTCTEWRNQVYRTIRQRAQNQVFSNMWTGIVSDTESINLSFKDFFNSWFVGANSSSQILRPITTNQKTMEMMETGDTNTSNSLTVTSSSGVATVTSTKSQNLNPVGFILTYGTANMEDYLKLQGENGRIEGLYPDNCISLFVTSDSIFVTSPKSLNPTLLNTAPSSGSNIGLLSSLMFPRCSHLVIESFLVPLMFTTENPCASKVFGLPSLSTVPKALILFQCLNLAEIDPGIVDVLQRLTTTAGSTGFPMVTAIYDWIDGDVQTESVVADAVVSGILISGDEFCSTSFVSLNILTDVGDWGLHLSKMKDFYDTNNYSCQIAMLFYHNDALKKHENLDSSTSFKMFMQRFREKLPKVKVHGIGSLSGPHTQIITSLSADDWKALNRNMVNLTGIAETCISCFQLVFVLIAYNAD